MVQSSVFYILGYYLDFGPSLATQSAYQRLEVLEACTELFQHFYLRAVFFDDLLYQMATYNASQSYNRS